VAADLGSWLCGSRLVAADLGSWLLISARAHIGGHLLHGRACCGDDLRLAAYTFWKAATKLRRASRGLASHVTRPSSAPHARPAPPPPLHPLVAQGLCRPATARPKPTHMGSVGPLSSAADSTGRCPAHRCPAFTIVYELVLVLVQRIGPVRLA
jgi:hypothetical protein